MKLFITRNSFDEIQIWEQIPETYLVGDSKPDSKKVYTHYIGKGMEMIALSLTQFQSLFPSVHMNVVGIYEVEGEFSVSIQQGK